jgi:hypothetical protein
MCLLHSRAVGHRFGKHLATAVPLAISYCDEAGENEEELQEYCLQVVSQALLESCLATWHPLCTLRL